MGACQLIARALSSRGESTLKGYATTCLACLQDTSVEEPLAPYQRLRRQATEREQRAKALGLQGASPATSRSGTPAIRDSNSSIFAREHGAPLP